MGEYIIKERVQEWLAISHDTLDRMINRGDIVAVKIGKAVRIDLASVERYIQAHTMGDKSTGETNG